ncbi:MAG: TlpA family protein disulfide reductase [Bacteroidetes bacterium]|jgi:thiol-disulfide isomerase/thioredoxin|nr:TlpA family protein disulfide reductase [Bacteroidota bacterium]
MRFKKITFSDIVTVVLTLITAALIFSIKARTWAIMGLMSLGFYNPKIPTIKPGEKLMPAPAMTVQTVDGKTIDLQQQKGKVVFINFWATWCPPCRAEMPSVNEFYEKVKNDPGIVFLSVDVDNRLNNSSAFMKSSGYNIPVYGGNLDGLPTTFYSGTIPTTLVIDKRGLVVFNHAGKASYDGDEFAKFVLGLTKQ